MENKELTVVEGETADNDGADTAATYVHKFKKLFEYEGKKYKTLNFYFDKLTGNDAIAVETETSVSGAFVSAQELSPLSLCMIAARAANVGSDVIRNMPISDFKAITGAARNFLLTSD